MEFWSSFRNAVNALILEYYLLLSSHKLDHKEERAITGAEQETITVSLCCEARVPIAFIITVVTTHLNGKVCSCFHSGCSQLKLGVGIEYLRIGRIKHLLPVKLYVYSQTSKHRLPISQWHFSQAASTHGWVFSRPIKGFCKTYISGSFGINQISCRPIQWMISMI